MYHINDPIVTPARIHKAKARGARGRDGAARLARFVGLAEDANSWEIFCGCQRQRAAALAELDALAALPDPTEPA